MQVAAFIVMAAAWASLFFWRSTPARLAQLIVFGLLGAVFTLAGGFAYWWDSHMQPSRSSPFLFGGGLLTLLSQAGTVLMAVFRDDSDVPWRDSPGRRTKARPKQPPRRQ
jgi:hypothetical protein